MRSRPRRDQPPALRVGYRKASCSVSGGANKPTPHSQRTSPVRNLKAMKSKYAFPYRFFLILAFVCAVSIGTAAAQSTGRLIVSRDPSFGRNLVLIVRLDGRTVANLMQGSRFDHSVWTGRRVLTVSASPSFSAPRPASTVLNVRRGRTYVFTAVRRRSTNTIALVPGWR